MVRLIVKEWVWMIEWKGVMLAVAECKNHISSLDLISIFGNSDIHGLRKSAELFWGELNSSVSFLYSTETFFIFINWERGFTLYLDAKVFLLNIKLIYLLPGYGNTDISSILSSLANQCLF